MSETASDLKRFLDILWPDLGGRWAVFVGLPSKRHEWTQVITAETLTMLEQWALKENVYIGCALRSQNFGPTMRGERDTCVAIPGLWLDVDWGQDHKKPNLPPTEEDALAVIDTMGPPPTIIINSGRGLQAWWKFKEPWILESDDDRNKAESLTKGWCTTLRTKAKAKGWDADQVGDLPRIMRLPGLWNRKGVPRRTKIRQINEAEYNPIDFDAYLLADLAEPQKTLKIDWTITKRADAEPPAHKYFLLCENDHDFKRLCLRIPREGQDDKSPSGFDHHLARIAFAAGWTAQEVVNLLISQRRHYKDDLKLNHPTYYESTLTSAISGKDEESRKQRAEAIKAGKAIDAPTIHDPAETFKILSELIGVQLTKLVRFRGGTNSYQLECEGYTIDISMVDMLDSQARFRRMILDYTGKRIEPMKERAWHDFVNRLFSASEDVHLAADATRRGAYENWVDLHVSESVKSQSLTSSDWEAACADNQPFKKDGRIYFVAEGFRNFLFSRFQEKITSQQLTAELTKLGYIYERLNVRNRKGNRSKRSCWQCP